MNTKTNIGTFNVECGHNHSAGDNVSLLIRQSEDGEEINLTVEDVLFKRDQFEVQTRSGLVIHMKNAPKIGQTICVQIKVECLA